MSSEKNKNNNRIFTEPYGGNFRALVGGQISIDSSSTPLYTIWCRRIIPNTSTRG